MEEFHLDDEQPDMSRFVQQKPLFIRLLLHTGLVSTDRQAQYLLLGLAALCFLIAAYILYTSTSVNHPSQAQLERAGKYLETYGSAPTQIR